MEDYPESEGDRDRERGGARGVEVSTSSTTYPKNRENMIINVPREYVYVYKK